MLANITTGKIRPKQSRLLHLVCDARDRHRRPGICSAFGRMIWACLGPRLRLPGPPAFAAPLGCSKQGLGPGVAIRQDPAWACPRLVASPAPLLMEDIREDMPGTWDRGRSILPRRAVRKRSILPGCRQRQLWRCVWNTHALCKCWLKRACAQ